MALQVIPEWIVNLDDEDVSFIKKFLLASGSLKEMARQYEVTYPTVRLRLDKLIQKITFNVALDKLTSTMVEDLAEIVKENPGNTELIFNIHSSGNNSLSLMSRKVKVRVEERLMRYIQDNDSIDIKIN